MCGIVAVLARRSERHAPDPQAVLRDLERAAGLVGSARAALTGGSGAVAAAIEALEEGAAVLEGADWALRGTPGLACLLAEPVLAVVGRVSVAAGPVTEVLEDLEVGLDAGTIVVEPGSQEALNAAVLQVKDALWAIRQDRVQMARAVADLAPWAADGACALGPAALEGLWAVAVCLGSLDRLEVRGRDSAGLHVLVADHGLDLGSAEIQALVGARASDPLFTSMAVRTPEGCLSLVYKAAAEIGELGDNVKALRAAVRADALLARALSSSSDARCTVMGHTRWASVGAISQPNAHPLNSDEVGRPAAPYVVAALNGDVDNHAELRIAESLSLPTEVTTDAKVIPTLISRRLADGAGLDEAFCSCAGRFAGSVAIAVSTASAPDEVRLAVRGSGQSLYVGLAEDAFVVASEPYGVVEETARYVRMDGGENTEGELTVLRRDAAGLLSGMQRRRYSGEEMPLAETDVVTASITTRDIDRGGFSHFLLKELWEAPASFRKTLRGRIVAGDAGRLAVRLGEEVLPAAVVSGLADGRIRKVLVIGQGTAAVAGQAAAAAIARCLPALAVRALPATELSGFALHDDMGDTLIVAISQSGTTTDTNRTVDLARARGAFVIAVVNRRHSDLTTKARGVLYTSDVRGVEMSFASTKAFYSQVAAGWLLAVGLGQASGSGDAALADRLLRSLRDLPDALAKVLERRDEIGRIAAALAPP
ncbi:MAG: SIS domain-containing protein, partial [Acidimicrobiales bacterium]